MADVGISKGVLIHGLDPDGVVRAVRVDAQGHIGLDSRVLVVHNGESTQAAVDAAVAAGASAESRWLVLKTPGAVEDLVTPSEHVDVAPITGVLAQRIQSGPTGAIKPLGLNGFVGSYVQLETASTHRGNSSVWDYPARPPKYTDANCVLIPLCDDMVKEWAIDSDVTWAELGGLNLAAYLMSKGVTMNHATCSNYLNSGGTVYATPAQVKELVARQGIEVVCHTKSHPLISIGATDAAIEAEVVTSRDEIETAIGSPVLSFAQSGSTNPQADPDTMLGAWLRSTYSCYRRSGTYQVYGDVCSMPLLGRYPYPGHFTFDNLDLADAGRGIVESVAWMQQLVGLLANSRGLIIMASFHRVWADDVDLRATGGLHVSTFKALVDALSVHVASGAIEIGTLADAPFYVPTYVPNLIPNPGFEHADAANGLGMPLDFQNASTNRIMVCRPYVGGLNTVTRAAGTRTGGSGTYMAVLAKPSVNGCNWRYTYLTVLPGRRYKLSFWAKTDSGSATSLRARLSIPGVSPLTDAAENIRKTEAFTLTEDWQQFTTFWAPRETQAHLEFSNLTTGREVHLDDVELR